MGWLIGPTMVSFVAAFLVLRLFDYAFSGVTGALVGWAKSVVFIFTWTAVTAKLGMRGFSSRTKKLRLSNAKAIKVLKAFSKGGRP